MKSLIKYFLSGSFLLYLLPPAGNAQSEKAVVKRYLSELPGTEKSEEPRKYKMTALYINRDLVGNFTGKSLVTGEYSTGLPGDSVRWNNAYFSESQNIDEPFPKGKKLDYIENFTYLPSSGMMQKEDFRGFPSTPDNIFARNLVWDMLSFEMFAWRYYDSLRLNVPYIVPDVKGEFAMAEIGNYSHRKITLCWEGITQSDGSLCALISFTAADNLLELDMPMIKSKGTEQYWGTILLSLDTKQIEHAVMYSGTMQELTIATMKDKILAKTIRELVVEKIQ